ncbi:hypothetical protein ACTWPT_58015 [Nonomuraea sp. 3N208]|uniref:hypothetical protein n=1 Tax=Nonomuraea sp. 3N208 TaxID=3457421 RepID=UPI003FD68CE6
MTAIAAGVLYLVSHITSVGGLVLYAPILDDPGIVGPGADTCVLWGAFLEGLLALALAYVGVRTLEAASIVTLLTVVTCS